MTAKSTFERKMENPEFKKAFEESYHELLLSELLIALMEKDHKTVRQLAKEVGVSPTVIQKIRSGGQADVKLSNFLNISHACGYSVILEKRKERIVLSNEQGGQGVFGSRSSSHKAVQSAVTREKIKGKPKHRSKAA